VNDDLLYSFVEQQICLLLEDIPLTHLVDFMVIKVVPLYH